MTTKSPQTIHFYINFFAVNLKVIITYSIDTYEKLILLHQTQANINYKYSTFNIQLSTLKRSNDTKKNLYLKSPNCFMPNWS